MANSFIKTVYNSSIWYKLVLAFSIVIIYYLYHRKSNNVEGFIQRQKFLIKEGREIYDPFYASIYDDLIFDTVRTEYEVGQILQSTQPTSQSLILDVGSGTGNHVNSFVSKGYNAVGLDVSPPMLEIARRKYPDLEFNIGDVEDVMTYPAHTYTHITCLNFTIYDIKDKFLFFRNCYEWLKPGGYLTVHLAHNDPVTGQPTSSVLLSSNNYSKLQNNRSFVRFDNFKYKSKFNIENNNGVFEEVFTDSNGKVRKNIHTLLMSSQDHIIKLAQDTGFILEGKIDLQPVQYDNQYIYIFYKPE